MASQRFDESLLQQEVQELTVMLRNEEILADLRSLLLQAGRDPQRVLLAGFLENADGFEAGVIITSEREVYHFERNVSQFGFSTWEHVNDISALIDTYPALLVALEMNVD